MIGDVNEAIESLNKLLPQLSVVSMQAKRIRELEAEIKAMKQSSKTTTMKKIRTKSASADEHDSMGANITPVGSLQGDHMKFPLHLDTFELSPQVSKSYSPRASPRASPRSKPRGLRSRTSSDDGILCNILHAQPPSLARMCSFKSGSESDSSEEEELPCFAPKGVDALKDFAVEPPKLNQTRCGYRLLTCNDHECEMQKIGTGLLHLPHVTKMLMKLKWVHKPKTVLIVKKPHEPDTRAAMLDTARYFKQEGISVVVESSVYDDKTHHDFVDTLNSLDVCGYYPSQISQLPIDFCVCLGGDGTIIWTCHLFPHGCPPVVSFAMGSLGFLSTFPLPELIPSLQRVMYEENPLTMRLRLEVTIKNVNGDEYRRTVLNEVVVDRGPNSTIVNLDLYIGKESKTPVTNVQGDGIIVSTPTGSTAYSLSAGGSMIYPSIPCVSVTPICPHSLSFRPLVLSDTNLVTLKVPSSARATAWVAFDGQDRIELQPGDSVICRVSSGALYSE